MELFGMIFLIMKRKCNQITFLGCEELISCLVSKTNPILLQKFKFFTMSPSGRRRIAFYGCFVEQRFRLAFNASRNFIDTVTFGASQSQNSNLPYHYVIITLLKRAFALFDLFINPDNWSILCCTEVIILTILM